MTITITNNKIAGFEPRWAPHRGFSLLFDNPGKSYSPMGEDWSKIDCSLEEGLQLYKGLAKFLDEMGQHRLTNMYLFCPLPLSSYHVTVWDGLNEGNAQNVSASYRSKIKDFLNNLPGSLLIDENFIGEVLHSPLITTTDGSIKFKFNELAKWGNQVLVARLMPADQDSEGKFERIVDARDTLSARFREQFEVEMRKGYSPHITLGYFANEEYGELATPQIAYWTELLKRKVGDQLITFSSISLYGFTDMVTFFKRV